ncbi:DUF1800 domain-containing protein [Hymenobacter elongatus]|uniref:DUF1800 domain-containing protein n=1 Tax=Hymenobacter elongatus TaxID=877208 RepID=A0A4Z0PH72_9BACT|nr:DUF1800 domain-containing protein [Hymenobacter elongatus]TGE14553.1 DUF1800 domain-containing protein [Hymenobacter elongatus]
MTNQQQLQHLYWRAGFGPRPADIAANLSPRKALRQLLHDAEQYQPLAGATMQAAQQQAMTPAPTPDLRQDPQAPTLKKGQMTPAERKEQNRQIRGAFYAMNTGWVERMATSPAQLREKMTFFWHGHFACRVRRPDAALQLNNTLRRLALGKFGDLLLAVSKEPAMLQFLNNQQNRKQRPNENFAREVLELFTIGRGHYSEPDIKEAARACTGWGYDEQGRFAFRERQHDDEAKTFMGRTGNFTGEDILKIILAQPQTAEFLTTKIYRFFVHDTPNAAHIKPLATAFFQSGYDIGDLMERLFSADWFYAPANVGTRIKSPIELLAGIKRTLGVELADKRPLIVFQKALGQTLFQPPNVAGWAGGRSWIDSSTLLFRLQLPQVLLKNAEINIALKDDENDIDPQMARADRTFRQPVEAKVKLAPLGLLLAGTPEAQQPARLSEFLLQAPIRPDNLQLVQQVAGNAPAEGRLRTMVTSLLSLPEYQLM